MPHDDIPEDGKPKKKTNEHIVERGAFAEDCKCNCVCGYLIAAYRNACGHHAARLARLGVRDVPRATELPPTPVRVPPAAVRAEALAALARVGLRHERLMPARPREGALA